MGGDGRASQRAESEPCGPATHWRRWLQGVRMYVGIKSTGGWDSKIGVIGE